MRAHDHSTRGPIFRSIARTRLHGRGLALEGPPNDGMVKEEGASRGVAGDAKAREIFTATLVPLGDLDCLKPCTLTARARHAEQAALNRHVGDVA